VRDDRPIEAVDSTDFAWDMGEMADTSRLRLVVRDDAGRPRLTPELLDSLKHALQGEQEASLVTIEGTAGSFCEGLDLDILVAQDEAIACTPGSYAALAQYAALLAAIEQAPRLVVALVDGPAQGGGVGLAAAADVVLASPRASFALPETLMGLIPAMVFPILARRIGVPRARLLALGAKPLSATVALQWGLVDEITDDLEAAFARHARRFARMDSRAIMGIKQLVATHFAPPVGYTADAATRFYELLASPETRARVRRYVAGEAPWPEENLP
jgi:enoyl-CoA hydratase/carnithine racemase